MLVGTHLVEVNGDPARGQFAPRLKCAGKFSAIDDGAPLLFFRGQAGSGSAPREYAPRPLALVVSQLYWMIGMAALQDSVSNKSEMTAVPPLYRSAMTRCCRSCLEITSMAARATRV